MGETGAQRSDERPLAGRVGGVGSEGGGVGGGAVDDTAGGRAAAAVGSGSVAQLIAEAFVGSGQPVQSRARSSAESCVVVGELAGQARDLSQPAAHQVTGAGEWGTRAKSCRAARFRRITE